MGHWCACPIFDMLSKGIYTTRHWQMSGRLGQELNVCIVTTLYHHCFCQPTAFFTAYLRRNVNQKLANSYCSHMAWMYAFFNGYFQAENMLTCRIRSLLILSIARQKLESGISPHVRLEVAMLASCCIRTTIRLDLLSPCCITSFKHASNNCSNSREVS